MVFSGIFPIDAADYENLRDALAKLQLNDSAFSYEPESSTALGFGYRCGYLGLLHMEIVQERLEREYNLNLITTAPSVVYRVFPHSGESVLDRQPGEAAAGSEHRAPRRADPHLPHPRAQRVPGRDAQAVPGPARQPEGHRVPRQLGQRVKLTYEMPLAEVVFDFFDKMKSVSRGYASLDYELAGYQTADLVQARHPDQRRAGRRARRSSSTASAPTSGATTSARKLKEVIQRQMFEVAIQAAIGAKVISRETISAMRKNVLAKCYGGDISRKRKLLEKQKEGKKRMKTVGTVEMPQEAFLAVLKTEE